jgi:hypothetical protein
MPHRNFRGPKDVSHTHRSLISVLLVLNQETLHHFLGHFAFRRSATTPAAILQAGGF